MAPYSIDELRRIIAPIANAHGVKSVSVFGSYSRGSASADSDVDLKIEKGQLRSLFQLSGFRLAVEDGQPAEILRRHLPDRMVEGVPQSAPFGRNASGGMRVLRSALDGKTEGKNLLQPVLLSLGDGPDARRGNLRMVRGGVYRRQRTRTAVLQPELRHSGPVHPAGPTGESAYPLRGA